MHIKVHNCCTQCFIPGIFGGFSPQKNLQPPKWLPNCALHLFSAGTMNYKYINNHRILFVTKHSKGCKFMPEMHPITFGSRAPLRPTERAYLLPGPPSQNVGLLIRGRRKGEGAFFYGEWEERADGKGGEFPLKKSQGEWNKQWS